MRIVSRVLFLIAAAALVLFSVSNRETVSVGLWPLPFLADLPLYLLCLFCALVGGLIGAGAGWAAGHRHRRELRSLRRRLAALERELTATQSRLEGELAATPPLRANRQLRRPAEETSPGAR